MSNANTIGRTLRVAIGHAPVGGNPPGLNAVVQPRHAERGIERLVPVFGDLFSRRLDLADLVSTARKDLGLVSVPVPLMSESRMRHALRCPLDLGDVPALAAVGGDFHLANGAATGPGQASDLV